MRVFAGLAAVVLAASSAAAADLVVTPAPYPVAQPHFALFFHAMPACTEPSVLSEISRKFAVYDANIIHSGLAITAIGGIRETRSSDGPSLVDRRYCTATAQLSNGRTSEVVFLIEGPMLGKYSLGYSIDSCLPAFDPYRVYDANCRSIRG
jgi:hypothetical protein